MTDQGPQWPIERGTMPAHLAAEAVANLGGWVYEIDGSMVRNPEATCLLKRSSITGWAGCRTRLPRRSAARSRLLWRVTATARQLGVYRNTVIHRPPLGRSW